MPNVAQFKAKQGKKPNFYAYKSALSNAKLSYDNVR